MVDNFFIDRINKIIGYIEENIKEKIILDDISKNINLSKYHLNRSFRAITNKQLMDYVRNRKLTLSINELLNTDLKIIDIAREYGFDHEQSFIRSFKNTFNISPGKFRKYRPILEITNVLNTNLLTPIEQDGLLIEPRILIKPTFNLIGIKNVIYCEEDKVSFVANRVGKDFFYNYRHLIKHPCNTDNYIAVIQYIEGRDDYTFYIPALEVSKIENIPKGMISLNIPTQTYAVFTYIGFHHPELINIKSLSTLQQYIFCKWLPHSGYSLSNTFHLESINYKISREDYCEIEIFIPINNKKNLGI